MAQEREAQILLLPWISHTCPLMHFFLQSMSHALNISHTDDNNDGDSNGREEELVGGGGDENGIVTRRRKETTRNVYLSSSSSPTSHALIVYSQARPDEERSHAEFICTTPSLLRDHKHPPEMSHHQRSSSPSVVIVCRMEIISFLPSIVPGCIWKVWSPTNSTYPQTVSPPPTPSSFCKWTYFLLLLHIESDNKTTIPSQGFKCPTLHLMD